MSSSSLQPENVENHTAAVATVFAQKLREMGVAQAYGVMGGAIAPFMKAVFDSEIQIVHCRHEAGAAFSAIEASLASRKPVVVFVTSGPGLANALNGIVAARWEGAHVIFVSSSSSPAHHGRVATQETTPDTMFGAGVFATGGALHLAATIDHPQKLAPTLVKIAAGLRRKSGFVAHVSIPISSLGAQCVAPTLPAVGAAQRDVARAAEHASLLASGSFVVWVGFGARHASDLVRRLAEQTGAPVMCSPRAKGIFGGIAALTAEFEVFSPREGNLL